MAATIAAGAIAPATLQPAPAAPATMLPPADIIQRQADDAGPTDAGGAGSAEDELATAQSQSTTVEMMAQKVYQILRRRLRVEQERARGWAR